MADNQPTDGEWDLFISYAGGDREAIVEPLARRLKKFGVKIWWDQFELELGDSLRRSIDEGLANSRFGAVLLSPNFLNQPWPEYELSGLVSRDLATGKVVLPIWYDISAGDLLAYSPSLADRKAHVLKRAPHDDDLAVLALELLAIVRPDILTRIHRRFSYLQSREQSAASWDELSTLRTPPRRHDELTPELQARVRLIRIALMNHYPRSMEAWIDGFLRDAHPSREIAIWEKIAACYLEYVLLPESADKLDPKNAYEILLDHSLFGLSDALFDDLGYEEQLLRLSYQSNVPLFEIVDDLNFAAEEAEAGPDLARDKENLGADVDNYEVGRITDSPAASRRLKELFDGLDPDV